MKLVKMKHIKITNDVKGALGALSLAAGDGTLVAGGWLACEQRKALALIVLTVGIVLVMWPVVALYGYATRSTGTEN